MLIRIALLMILLCLPIFLLAKVLLIFTFALFAALATQLAAFLLLAAFGLLIFGGLFFGLKRMFETMRDFCSAHKREYRKVLFIKNQHSDKKRRFYFQRLQLHYFNERERRKLLEKNTQQQINALADSIEHDLRRIKHKLSKDIFSQLQLENRRYRTKQDEQALLKLHLKIVNLTGK